MSAVLPPAQHGTGSNGRRAGIRHIQVSTVSGDCRITQARSLLPPQFRAYRDGYFDETLCD